MNDSSMIEDAMRIHSIGISVISFSGIVFNGILLYFIVSNGNERMHKYKIILIDGCLTYLLFSIATFVFSPLLVSSNGNSYTFMNNPASKITPMFGQHVVHMIWLFCFFKIASSLPIQFIYRFHLVWSKSVMSTGFYLTLHFICSALNVVYCGIAIANKIWIHEINHSRLVPGIPQEAASIVMAKMFYSTFIYYFGNCVYILVYAIVVFCSVAVFIRLRKQINMSKSAVMTNLQLSIVMIVQAILPLVVQFGPTAIFYFASNFFQIKAILITFPISILYAFMGPTFALCVLLVIKSYRRRIFNLTMKMIGAGTTASSVASVNQNQTITVKTAVTFGKIR